MKKNDRRGWGRAATGFAAGVCLAVVLASCAFGRHMERGDEYYRLGNYDAALAEYEAALKLDADSEEARQKVAETKIARVAEHHDAATQAIETGDHLGAITAAHHAHTLLPEEDQVQALVAKVSTAAQAQAASQAEQGQFRAALDLSEAIARELPTEASAVAPKIRDIRRLWTAALAEKAVQAKTAARHGDALLLLAKAAQLSEDPALAVERDDQRGTLGRLRAYVVQPQGSARDRGYQVIAARLASTGAGSSLTILPPGAEADTVHGIASIRVGRPSFRTEQSQRQTSVTYQSGTRMVPNPFYKSRQDDLLREERQLVRYEKDVSKYENYVQRYEQDVAREGPSPNTSTGAEQNLTNARSNLESARRRVGDQRNRVMRAKESLAREPQTKEEAVYSDHRYTVTTHTLTGTADIQVSVTHTDGRTAITRDRALRVSASDDTHASQLVANVAADPLRLPSNSDLTGELYDRATDETVATIAASFHDWRQRILAQARAETSDDRRADLLAIYLFTHPAEVSADVIEELVTLRDIPDAAALLAR